MTDQQDDERRLFEAVERRNANLPDNHRFPRPGGLRYEQRSREDRWQGWLARSMAPVVTEARIEAGARALVKHDEYEWDKQQYEAKENAKDQARACLTAALSPHGERVDG